MPRIDSEAFYTNAIAKHGLTPAGVCWLSSAHQHIRFEILRELLPEKLEDFTLTDAGCGFGDFFIYLQNSHALPKKYLGIDSLAIMCEIAAKKTDQEILHADITNKQLPVSDYVVCSGALNILTPFETVQFIQNCFYAAKKAFVFNVLCGNKASPTYNYLTQTKLKQIARELNVSHVVFKEAYLDNDISVGFYK